MLDVAAEAEPLLDEAVALPLEPEPEPLPLEPLAVDDGPAEELEDAPAPDALAFCLPQTKDWQKVWPLRSLGWAAVHWPTHESHSREGRVWP